MKIFISLLSILSLSFGLAQNTTGGEMTGGDMTGGASEGSSAGAVQVAQEAALGSFLVDAEGMTLYLFTNDSENTSTCYDSCAENWPPLLSEGEPSVGEGVNAELLGTTERDDGTVQVTYGGWPLYTFVSDENTGDTSGQGVGGVWFVISPEGEVVE